ncbi:hypothetical protein Syun_007380 [Stephania yunnanensis]|uniref:Uncharacterized protein n=1 Tax=Stephania yunnanensis TaxID=152371 RepID=A0AAP0L1X6_9MAGN
MSRGWAFTNSAFCKCAIGVHVHVDGPLDRPNPSVSGRRKVRIRGRGGRGHGTTVEGGRRLFKEGRGKRSVESVTARTSWTKPRKPRYRPHRQCGPLRGNPTPSTVPVVFHPSPEVHTAYEGGTGVSSASSKRSGPLQRETPWREEEGGDGLGSKDTRRCTHAVGKEERRLWGSGARSSDSGGSHQQQRQLYVEEAAPVGQRSSGGEIGGPIGPWSKLTSCCVTSQLCSLLGARQSGAEDALAGALVCSGNPALRFVDDADCAAPIRVQGLNFRGQTGPWMRWAKTYVPAQRTGCWVTRQRCPPPGSLLGTVPGTPYDALAGDSNPIAAFVGDAAPY